MVNFSTLIRIVAETAIVLLSHIARWFPIANNLQEFFVPPLFCSLILDHGRSSQKFPLLAPKFLFRISCSILLFTIVFNL